jgi:hypothetical protein
VTVAPIWILPFLWILVALVARVGTLPIAMIGVTVTEVVLVSGYVILRSRRDRTDLQPVARLLPLLPGHLLVLLMLALLDSPGLLAWLWTLVPAVTLAYDIVGRCATLSGKRRMSISMILYGILWGDLFFLLERAVVLHRGIQGTGEIVIAAAFGVLGVLFLWVGAVRHWSVAKE